MALTRSDPSDFTLLPRVLEQPSNSISMTTHGALPREIIWSAGDVILRCKNAEFKVSSTFLTAASSVFRTMLLTPNFTEGQAFLRNGQVELSLPEDNTDVRRLLLRELHFSDVERPDHLTIATLTELAILCDKYDVVRVVGAQVRSWLRPHLAGQ